MYMSIPIISIMFDSSSSSSSRSSSSSNLRLKLRKYNGNIKK